MKDGLVKAASLRGQPAAAAGVSPKRVKEAEDHRVKSLPGLRVHDLVHYAGHVEIDASRDANIFYWLFESTSKAKDVPIIIWLNGGPGCSSMIGQFIEVGPLGLTEKGDMTLNQHAWSKVGHLLFIDQPVGTGYSFTSKGGHCKNDHECNRDFYLFMINFFKLHNRFMTRNDKGGYATRRIIMTGESHAGHVIPSFTKFVIEKNAEGALNQIVLNIDSVAIGNGWIDPLEQYDVAEYSHSMGLITSKQKDSMLVKKKHCQSSLIKGQLNSRLCYRLLDDVIDMTRKSDRKRALIYDIRERVVSDAFFPPGHKKFESYLNRADVKIALHVNRVNHRFGQCLDPPYFALKHQDGKGVSEELAFILNNKVKVVLFTGQYDLICNYMSLDASISKLKWNGSAKWNDEILHRWGSDGWIKSSGPLSSIVYSNAGHMVAMDQRQSTLNMMKTIVDRKKFTKGEMASMAELRGKVQSRRLDTTPTVVVASPPASFLATPPFTLTGSLLVCMLILLAYGRFRGKLG